MHLTVCFSHCDYEYDLFEKGHVRAECCRVVSGSSQRNQDALKDINNGGTLQTRHSNTSMI